MRKIISFMLLFLLFFSCNTTPKKVEQVEKTELENTVSKVDHILLEADDSEALYNFFTNVLELPSVWPYTQYDGFASGGVYVGNVNLEPLYYRDNPEPSIVGFAFEPSEPTKIITKRLFKNKISYDTPIDYMFYVNTSLHLLDTVSIFFCDYLNNRGFTSITKDIPPVGPLGLLNVDVINIETKGELDNWDKVLYPATSIDNRYDMEDGPDISVVPGESDTITSLIFNVSDIKKCKEGLTELGMLGKTEGDIIYTNPENSMGLLFGFKEI